MAEKTKVKKKKKGKEEPGRDQVRFPKIPKVRHQIPRGEHRGMRLILIENVPHLGRRATSSK